MICSPIRSGVLRAAALLLVFSVGTPFLRAQEIPSGGTSLVSVADIAVNGSFYANEDTEGAIASRSTVTVTGQSFTSAARIDVARPTGNFWNSAVTQTTNRALANGDVVLLHFFMRAIETTDETGTVTLQAYFEGPAPDYSKSLSYRASATSEWTEYFLPFAVDGTYAAGVAGMKFGFTASARAQVLEFGGVELLWYGKTRTLAEMPRTSFQYEGRPANAPWRAQAAARIEQYRKANFTVDVRDSGGAPLPGATVSVRQRRHAFGFGSAMVASRLMGAGASNDTYRAHVLELFNTGTFENDLKWEPWIGDWSSSFSRSQTLAALQWLQEQGIPMRGHVLVWPSTRNMPDSFTSRINSADPTVPAAILDHIDDVMVPTTPYLEEWDVINEPYDNFDVMATYGYEHMIDWFERARANHATADLYINDYGILSGGGLNTTKQNAYAETVQYLLDGGAPVTGIGFQGHFSATPTGITRIWQILERYATEFPDLKFRITELDLSTDDESMQADFYRDLLTIAISHPQMEGVQFWGFWEGAHWRDTAAMFRTDWTAKPAADAYRQLVYDDWWTEVEAAVGADGTITGRGFHGTYEYQVTYGDTVQSGSFDLAAGDATVTVQLDVAGEPLPAIVTQPLGATAAPGGSVTLSTAASGSPAPTITWHRDSASGTVVGTGSELTLASLTAADAGTYVAVATNASGAATTRPVKVGVRATGTQTERLANISTRGNVSTGAAALVAGFVISGSEAKDVVIRAVGPRLGSYGLPDTLADPRIRIFKGAEQVTPLVENDDWSSDLADDFAALGAFDLSGDTKSAAVRVALEPDSYTVQVLGVADGTGLAIVEVYDAATGQPVEMVNISTRGNVGTGLQKLVGGFVVSGDVPRQVLIRGIGPGLAAYGVPGTLADPIIRLYETDSEGQPRFLRANDNWTAGDIETIESVSASIGAFALERGSNDAVLLVSLEPGSYTVELSGVGDTTGIAIVEVYRGP